MTLRGRWRLWQGALQLWHQECAPENLQATANKLCLDNRFANKCMWNNTWKTYSSSSLPNRTCAVVVFQPDTTPHITGWEYPRTTVVPPPTVCTALACMHYSPANICAHLNPGNERLSDDQHDATITSYAVASPLTSFSYGSCYWLSVIWVIFK